MAQNDISGDEEKSRYMCLRCRQTGHIFNNCRNELFTEVWITSSRRKEMYYGYLPELVDEPLCQQCEDLDILGFLEQDIKWDSLLYLPDDTVWGAGDCLRKVGNVGTHIFRDDCQLCRCLYTMIPEPERAEDVIWLFPGWTMCRLEGGISIDTPEKQQYSRVIQVVLDPDPWRRFLSDIAQRGDALRLLLEDATESHPSLGGRCIDELLLSNTAQRGDALCLLSEDATESHPSLGGRCIDPTSIDFETIDRWISSCRKLHPVTCVTRWSEELLSISLIDVVSRQLVKYPADKCDYLALSYVWGGVTQGHYRLGSPLGSLPQTIEDAITFTLRLGKQYLWVDSICIDQSDEEEKLRQIRMMSLIYEGADATIIALSGRSATAGLPKISHNHSPTPQMKCCVDGKRLVGTMPTLSQSVWVSSWGDRAWTLQEALLSRRCIYIGDDQVLFECNAMQCSEALDDSTSWVHQTYRDEDFHENRFSEALVGAGVLRSPFVGDLNRNNRLEQYTVLANLYSFRNMSFEADAINGFSGILQYLTRLVYTSGFFFGLPHDDLNWALLWSFQSQLVRRANFPSWSWAGWSTRLVEMRPFDITKPHQHPIYLKIWKFESDELILLQSLPAERKAELEESMEQMDINDRLPKLIAAPSKPAEFNFTAIPKSEVGQSLFIEGLIVKFKPYYKQPLRLSNKWGHNSFYRMKLGGISCTLKIIHRDEILTDKAYRKGLRCLLLARDQDEDLNYYHFIVLKGRGPVVSRKSVITIYVNRLENLLNHVDVEKQRIVLT